MKNSMKVFVALFMTAMSTAVFADVGKLLNYVPEGSENVSVINIDNVRRFIPFVESSVEKAFADNENMKAQFKKTSDQFKQFNQFLLKYNLSMNDINGVCCFGPLKGGLMLIDSTISPQQLDSILGLIKQDSQQKGEGDAIIFEKSVTDDYVMYTIELDENLKQKMLTNIPGKCKNSKKLEKAKEKLKNLKAYVTFLDAGTILCSTNKEQFETYLENKINNKLFPATINNRNEIVDADLIFYHYGKAPVKIENDSLDVTLMGEKVKEEKKASVHPHKQFMKAVKSTEMFLVFDAEVNEFTFKNDLVVDDSANGQMIANMAVMVSGFMKMHNIDFIVNTAKKADGTTYLNVSLKGGIDFLEKVFNAVKLMAGQHGQMKGKIETQKGESEAPSGLTIRKEN